MELTETIKALFKDTAKQLKGSARRVFMARTVGELGPGGPSVAERELGWNRGTLRKGLHELHSGVSCVDAFALRGRKRAEEHSPHLLEDIRAIVASQRQADPQFLHRIVAFVAQFGVSVRLAYYPPYHSKYNAVERCWGILERHWNGSLLDSLEAVVGHTASMTWKGVHPVVELITTTYQTGVKLTKAAMAAVEAQVCRLPALGKWFVDILYQPPATADA